MEPKHFLSIDKAITRTLTEHKEFDSFLSRIRLDVQEMLTKEAPATKENVVEYLLACGVSRPAIDEILEHWPNIEAEQRYYKETQSGQYSLFDSEQGDPGDEQPE
jgi:hypothetical protein